MTASQPRPPTPIQHIRQRTRHGGHRQHDTGNQSPPNTATTGNVGTNGAAIVVSFSQSLTQAAGIHFHQASTNDRAAHPVRIRNGHRQQWPHLQPISSAPGDGLTTTATSQHPYSAYGKEPSTANQHTTPATSHRPTRLHLATWERMARQSL